MSKKLISLILSLIFLLTVVLFDVANVRSIDQLTGSYSVYVNNVFYGNVKDRDIFDDYVEDMYKKYNKESEIGEVYYPENYHIDSLTSAFDTDKSDQEIFEAFKANLEFLVDGYKLSIVKNRGEDGEGNNSEYVQGGEAKLTSSSNYAILYSTDKEEVDKAFSKIIETFVEEEAIEKIALGETVENFEVGTEETISYSVGGTVVGSEGRVPYDKVLTGQDLYKKMLFYNVNEDKKHIVQPGETLKDLANKNMLNVKELIAANETLVNENTILAPGQELIVNLVDPVVTVESTKVIVAEETISRETEVIENENMLTTDKDIIKDEGSDGKVVRVYEVDFLNGQTTSGGKIIHENTIEEPRTKVIVKGTKVAPSYTPSYSRSSGISGYTTSTGYTDGSPVAWGKATQGGYISSYVGPRWGSYHAGIDIAGLPTGSSILSVYDGVIVYTGYQGARGNLVIIDHENGYVTYSQHLNVIDVQVGQRVYKGQRIGGMGATGVVTGVHLHFEVFVNGKLVDPMSVSTWN